MPDSYLLAKLVSTRSVSLRGVQAFPSRLTLVSACFLQGPWGDRTLRHKHAHSVNNHLMAAYRRPSHGIYIEQSPHSWLQTAGWWVEKTCLTPIPEQHPFPNGCLAVNSSRSYLAGGSYVMYYKWSVPNKYCTNFRVAQFRDCSQSQRAFVELKLVILGWFWRFFTLCRGPTPSYIGPLS